ncbi:hypothetical protein PhaeoP51_03515 [Phaeobacter inhibens]|nr:hypothetical protein PhaeoP51_03515 [Phaeobacter inhibens]
MRGVHHLGGLASAGASLKGAGKGGGSDAEIVRLPTGSGQYTCPTFSTPSSNPRSITVDPATGNLVSYDFATDLIYVHDGLTGTVLSSFASPDPSATIEDMEIDPATGNLLLMGGGKVQIQDGVSETALMEIAGVGGSGFTVLSGNFVTTSGHTIRTHDGFSSTVASSVTVDSNLPTLVGLTVDPTGQFLVCAGNNNSDPSLIYVTPETGSFAAGFRTCPSCHGVAFDQEGRVVTMTRTGDKFYVPVMENGFVADGAIYAARPDQYTRDDNFS